MQSGQEGPSDSSSDQSFMNGVIISMTLSKGVNVGTCTQQRRRGDSHHVGNHCATHIESCGALNRAGHFCKEIGQILSKLILKQNILKIQKPIGIITKNPNIRMEPCPTQTPGPKIKSNPIIYFIVSNHVYSQTHLQ